MTAYNPKLAHYVQQDMIVTGVHAHINNDRVSFRLAGIDKGTNDKLSRFVHKSTAVCASQTLNLPISYHFKSHGI